MRTQIVAAFVAAVALAPIASAQILVGRQCEVSALPKNSNLDNLRKLTGGDEPVQIQTCTWRQAEPKTYTLFTKPEALIEGVCRYRSEVIYQEGIRDGYLEWSNSPPTRSSTDNLIPLAKAPGHPSAYLALGKPPCPPLGDSNYIDTTDISVKKFVEIMNLWRAITANESSFNKFFGGEDVVSKDKSLTLVRDHLFLSKHAQDQEVVSAIKREKLSLIDWITPSYGISVSFGDLTYYEIVVRDGVGGLSFRRIDEVII